MRSPLFLFLLPVFFVFHGYVEYHRTLEFADCLPLLGIYLAAAAILYLVCRLMLKDPIKAALLSTWILSFYFFFGALHDTLRVHRIFLHRYVFILPLFGLVTIALIVYLKRKKQFGRIPLFLNSLLLIYLLVDAGALIAATVKPSNGEAGYGQPPADMVYRACDTCAKPDIYFLLFDGYNANVTLRDYYHYDNSGLDSFLFQEKFHIQPQSRSNYYATMFSMASMLNMRYLDVDANKITSDDFTNLFGQIRHNEVIRYLGSQGYSIVNYSIFDVADHPSLTDQPFIPTKTKLITERTLVNYVVRDLGKWWVEHVADPRTEVNWTYDANQRLFAYAMKEPARTAAQPRFVYCHLVMPHFPHLFDSLQHRRDPMEVAREREYFHKEPYLNYIPYTNARIRELIGAIKKNTGGKAVIIFMSDHGFRYCGVGSDERTWFHNQNAIYMPDGNYRGFYDSMSAVNEFRVLFNNRFGQQFPMLSDSTIPLSLMSIKASGDGAAHNK